MPPRERFIVSTVSVNFTPASIVSSDITIPSSCALFFSVSVLSAVSLKRAVSSCPDFPKRSFASAALSVESSIPCIPAITRSNTSSRLMEFKSSIEIPSFVNISAAELVPFLASSILLVRVFMPVAIEFISTPA